MRIRAILLDLDQTLIDRDATFLRFAHAQWHRFPDAFLTVDPDHYCRTLAEYDNHGYVAKEDVYDQVCDRLHLKVAPSELLADFRAFYGEDVVLAKGALAVLIELQKTFPLGLITNGRSKAQRAKIDHSGIGPYFQVIAISEEIGFKKPAPQIYEHCLQSLGTRPEETLCIGDHPELDVRGPREVGMKGVWLRNPHFAEPLEHDGIIDRLSDLPQLLASDVHCATASSQNESPSET